MKKIFIIVALLLLPMVAQARTFYITQGMGLETWVIAMSSRTDGPNLSYEVYGGEVVEAEQIPITLRPRSLSWWEAA